MADDKYLPHPLVAELAKGLTRNVDGDLSESGDRLEQAQQNLAVQVSQPPTDEQVAVEDAAIELADEIATNPNLAEVHTFAGFLGGKLDDTTRSTDSTGSTGSTGSVWRLLYLDPKLRTWLLVDQKGIALAKREVADETSPFGTRDHVWVKSDASVSHGEGALQKNEIQARFMRGAFVSAAEFAASVSGGTFSSVTGPACPLTPGCCGIRTR